MGDELITLLPYITWDVDPLIFPPFEFLKWYGLLWVTGIILGYQLLPSSDADRLTLYVLIGAIVGARLGHVLFYEPLYYWNNPIEILPIKLNPQIRFTGLAGLASHGGMIGTLIALYVYNRKYKKGYLWMLDRLIIPGALLGGFIRLGNLMNAEIVGLPTELPWAFVFARIDQIPRHPSQLYESIFYFLIFILLFRLWKSGLAYYRGLLFGLGLTFIFTYRFAVEFFKEDQVAIESEWLLNLGQILSIPMILAGIVLVIWSVRQAKKAFK